MLRERPAWTVLAVVAALLAIVTLVRWAATLSADIPVLYGEGAVVHAGQLVARGADPYAATSDGTFVAANYPPLSFAIVAALTPFGVFTPYRIVSALAAVAIAGLIAWRARRAPLVGGALALSFVALFPLEIWGTAVKPDLVAVALTAFAAVRAGPSWRDASTAGALGALAIAAKPTAAAPLAAVALYLLWRERMTGVRTVVALALALAVLVAVALLRFSPEGLWTHLVTWNALPYSVEQTVLLVVAGMLTIGIFVVLGARHGDGRMRAYVAGASVVMLLGGREGATINYLIDLAAASLVAVAPRAASLSGLAPGALLVQLAISLAAVWGGVFAPDDLAGARARVAHAADLAPSAAHLAEDSGILLANRIEPVVDDLFLWSRLVSRGLIADTLTPRVRRGDLASVSSSVVLDRLDDAPAYERLRWPDALVAAVLDTYVLDVDVPGYHRYVPR